MARPREDIGLLVLVPLLFVVMIAGLALAIGSASRPAAPKPAKAKPDYHGKTVHQVFEQDGRVYIYFSDGTRAVVGGYKGAHLRDE